MNIKEVIRSVFNNSNYNEIDIKWGEKDTLTFINSIDETYVILFDDLTKGLVEEVFNLCAEDIYSSRSINMANKSNLSVITVAKVNDSALSSVEKNILFQIEENELFFKKFVLWYTQEELDGLINICSSCFEHKNLEKNLLDYNLFKSFKENKENEKGYALLSRLFIKFPFLTLLNVKKYDKKLTELINNNLNEISSQLTFEELSSKDVNDLLDLVPVDKKEIAEIEKEIEKLVGKQG